MKHIRYFFIGLYLLAAGCQTEEIALFDDKFGIQILTKGGIGTEGPCIDRLGNVYYSDQGNDVVSMITPEGNRKVFMSPSGVANGILMDYEGRLVMCQSNNSDYKGTDNTAGKRSVIRIEADSSITVLAESYNGSPFLAPNDLCIDKKGRIYFTDPYYPGPKAEKTQPTSGVYRIDGPGQVTLVVSDLEKPNGILITPDNDYIYVADRGTQKLHKYKIEDDGSLTHEKVAYAFPADDRGIDGMAIDSNGYIYASAGQQKTTGVYVIDPEKGKLLDSRLLPSFAFNLCFGGKDGKDLYVAAGGNMYLMRTMSPGIVLPNH